MVAILDRNAKLIERVSCDATSGGGNARHHRAADLDGDGVVDSSDQLILQGNWGNYGVGDLNRDGVVDSSDLLILQGNWGGALVAGELSQTDNIIGYAGYIFNAELVSAGSAGLYTVRHRHYAPDLGRWLSRDPIGYVDGMSLYEYVRGRAVVATDPLGLYGGLWVDPGDGILRPWPPPSDEVTLRDCVHLAKGSPIPPGQECLEYGDLTVQPFRIPVIPYRGPAQLVPITVEPRCVCFCMGNGTWANRVRACLRCMVDRGVEIMKAHDLCFGKDGFGMTLRQQLDLLICIGACGPDPDCDDD